MMVSFKEVFFENEKTRKLYEEIREKALKERWCSTCGHCKDDPDGIWCEVWNKPAETTCLFYELDETKV